MSNWFTIGSQNGNECLNCNASIKDVGYTHTNTGVCPNCKIPCIFYGSGKKKVIQVIPERSPESFKKFIQWFQSELNEIEFLALFGALRRIAIANENFSDEG